MLVTSNDSFKYLLGKVGAQVVEPTDEPLELKKASALEYSETYVGLIKLIESGMYVAPAYKNKRTPFTPLYARGNASLVAAWRGVKNSARVMFIGNASFVKFMNSQNDNEKSLGVKSMYDFINWFTMATNVIRVS